MSTSAIKTEDTTFDPSTVEIGAVTASSTLTVPVPDNEAIVPKTAQPSPFSASAAPETTLTSSPEPTSPSSAMAAKTKSKKKKQQSPPPAVTMATAAAASSGSTGAQGENTGRWTAEEHRLFLQGLDQHGKGWKKIASLIKSRTVVQIRTHAQKYFQKLAKARQNGDDGDVSMEGRGNPATVVTATATGVQTTKRRRQTTGTKRKAISSVVASAQRQGKRMATEQGEAVTGADGVSNPMPPLPAVAPALAPFVPSTTIPSITTANGTISGPALEDSLFRFLTPGPVAADPSQAAVNEVARQAGANPITLPSENPSAQQPAVSGEVSPTGVNDLVMYPSWADVKDMPSWYAKGADVDCLLDVADTIDWLTDTGDLHETYEPPKVSLASPPEDNEEQQMGNKQAPNLSTDALAAMDSDAPVAALPSLFENAEPSKKQDANLEEHLNVFDTPMEEHAFVTALLENNGESSGSLPVIS